MSKIVIKNIDAMIDFSHQIAKNIKPLQTVCLYGSLGVGKSFFAKNFINYLQDKPTEVLSPTFNLIYGYETKIGKVFHCDLYRLKHESELENIGFFDIIQNHIALIEWPEIAERYLPKNSIKIIIKNIFNVENNINNEIREIIINNNEYI